MHSCVQDVVVKRIASLAARASADEHQQHQGGVGLQACCPASTLRCIDSAADVRVGLPPLPPSAPRSVPVPHPRTHLQHHYSHGRSDSASSYEALRGFFSGHAAKAVEREPQPVSL